MSDPEKRKLYDEQGSAAFDENGEQKNPGFGGFGRGGGGQHFNFEFKDPFDLFSKYDNNATLFLT